MLFFKKKEKVPVSTQNIDVYQEKQLELEETVFDTKQTNVDTLDSANIELSEPDNADSCLEGNVPVNNGNMENTNGKLLDSNSTNKIIDVISNEYYKLIHHLDSNFEVILKVLNDNKYTIDNTFLNRESVLLKEGNNE